MYLLFCWTLIPGLVSLVELLIIRGRVSDYNEATASEIVMKLKGIR